MKDQDNNSKKKLKPKNNKNNINKSKSKVKNKSNKNLKNIDNDKINTIKLETNRNKEEEYKHSSEVSNNNKYCNSINSYEIKQFGISNNLQTLSNQIENCDRLINIQDDLFSKISKMNKNIMENNLKFERNIAKCESENYYNLFKNYTDILEELIIKLNSQLDKIEELKIVKEELKTLKLKEEIRNAKMSEEKMAISSKFESFKNYLTLELNNFIDFVNENCANNNSMINKFTNDNICENAISMCFYNSKLIIKKLITNLNTIDSNKNKNIANSCSNKFLPTNNDDIIDNKLKPVKYDNIDTQSNIQYKTKIKDLINEIKTNISYTNKNDDNSYLKKSLNNKNNLYLNYNYENFPEYND